MSDLEEILNSYSSFAGWFPRKFIAVVAKAAKAIQISKKVHTDLYFSEGVKCRARERTEDFCVT